MHTKKGFSLIELLVVIAITAVLLAVALPNFLSARERARDAQKKQELDEMKKALQLYYSDEQGYPAAAGFVCGVGKMNYIASCGEYNNACCPCDASVDFAVGATCSTVYMKRFPSSFGSSIFYYASGDDFCLKYSLENAGDGDIAKSQLRCGSSCTTAGGTCAGSDYCVCAD